MAAATRTGGRKDEIVDAALSLLATTSLEALSTRQIAGALGLTQPALFRHFESREALLRAVVERARTTLSAMVTEIVSREAPAVDRLRALFAGLLAHVERTPGFPRLVFAEAASPGASGKFGIGRVAGLLRSVATALVDEARRAGEVAASVEPGVAGMAFTALAQGTVLAWQIDGQPRGLAGRAGGTVEILLAGLGAASPSGARPEARRRAARPRARAVTIDAGALLAEGKNPLATTLDALARLEPGGLVELRAPFRPEPLLRMIERRGWVVRERAADDGFACAIVAAPPASARGR